MRHFDWYDFGTELLICINSFFQGFAALVIETFHKEFFRHADFHAFYIIDQRFFVIFLFLWDRRRVFCIVAGNGIEDNGTVFYVIGKRSNLIEGRTVGDKAIPGNEAIRRFEAYEAAVGSRLADRAACIRTEGPDRFPGGYGSGGTAGRTARYIVQIPGIMRNLICRVFRRTAMANSSIFVLPRLI